MEVTRTYNMSFTAGAAMLNETYAVAEVLLECEGDWERTKDRTLRENLMEKDKMSSNQRYFVLMKQRLETLNQAELEMLVDSTVAVRRQFELRFPEYPKENIIPIYALEALKQEGGLHCCSWNILK